MTLKKAVQLSLITHVVSMWLMVGAPIGCSRGGGEGDSKTKGEQAKADSKKEEIVDKEAPDQTTEVTLIEQTKEEFEAGIERARRKEIAECEPHFGGIGITHDGRSGVVTIVHKYYPAYDAGVQVGDEIVTPLKDIKGEIGTLLKFELNRNGKRLTLDIIRGRICTKDFKPEERP